MVGANTIAGGADLLGKGMLRLEEMLEPNSAVYRSGGVVESTTTCSGEFRDKLYRRKGPWVTK